MSEQRPASTSPPVAEGTALGAAALKKLCLEAGADDVGFVELDRPELADQRDDILSALPATRYLISFVCRMNRDSIRSPARSIANLEFHHSGDEVNEVGRRIVRALERQGIRALNPAMGFPMEMDRFPGKIWVVSHKKVAVAAGLGQMGIHRNVIHPKYGNFVLLGTILVAAELDEGDEPIDYNPCLECKLCVAACPTGAIHSDGAFDFSACYTHNYREFMGGFTDWVEKVADSGSGREYRQKFSDAESASMWQSLSYGANYKAAYCMAVCPAGEDVIAPFKLDRKAFLKSVVKPLQGKAESVYVVPNTDAEAYVKKRYPHKNVRYVGNSLRPGSIGGFLDGLPLVFQRRKAKGLKAVYHFVFTGEESAEATVEIDDGSLRVCDGLLGKADLRVIAQDKAWLEFLAGERHIALLLLRRRIKLKGSPRLLLRFGECFPV